MLSSDESKFVGGPSYHIPRVSKKLEERTAVFVFILVAMNISIARHGTWEKSNEYWQYMYLLVCVLVVLLPLYGAQQYAWIVSIVCACGTAAQQHTLLYKLFIEL